MKTALFSSTNPSPLDGSRPMTTPLPSPVTYRELFCTTVPVVGPLFPPTVVPMVMAVPAVRITLSETMQASQAEASRALLPPPSEKRIRLRVIRTSCIRPITIEPAVWIP